MPVLAYVSDNQKLSLFDALKLYVLSTHVNSQHMKVMSCSLRAWNQHTSMPEIASRHFTPGPYS